MTTFGETTYRCPICEEEVPARVLHSTNQMGQDTDLCPITMGFHAVPLLVNACLNCGYAGYGEDFEGKNLSPEEKVRFLDARIPDGLIPLEARLDDLSPDHVYYLAYLTRRQFRSTPAELADLLLRASWCLRLDGGRPSDDVAASRYRRQAIREFGKALRTPETDEASRKAYRYLLGELNRREGDFEQAQAHFTSFLEAPPGEKEWTRAASALLERARKGDTSHLSFQDVLEPSEGA
ncbi:MAG: DUF2225 domain-containing protein [Planctomycetota bacterium]|jgi:uncharacterized protein (DUF2225 family)